MSRVFFKIFICWGSGSCVYRGYTFLTSRTSSLSSSWLCSFIIAGFLEFVKGFSKVFEKFFRCPLLLPTCALVIYVPMFQGSRQVFLRWSSPPLDNYNYNRFSRKVNTLFEIFFVKFLTGARAKSAEALYQAMAIPTPTGQQWYPKAFKIIIKLSVWGLVHL